MKPADAFEGQMLNRLFRVLEDGARVKTLSTQRIKQLAAGVRDAERPLHAELAACAQAFWDQGACWQAEDKGSV